MQRNQVESCEKCLLEKFTNGTKTASSTDLLRKSSGAMC